MTLEDSTAAQRIAMFSMTLQQEMPEGQWLNRPTAVGCGLDSPALEYQLVHLGSGAEEDYRHPCSRTIRSIRLPTARELEAGKTVTWLH